MTGCGLHSDCGFDRQGRQDGGSYIIWDDVRHGDRAAQRQQQTVMDRIRDSRADQAVIVHKEHNQKIDRQIERAGRDALDREMQRLHAMSPSELKAAARLEPMAWSLYYLSDTKKESR